MATFGMDKGLYQAPQGIPMEDMGPGIEIEIEDPEAVRIGMGGFEIDLEPRKPNEEGDFNANLAELMDDKELAGLATDLIADFDKDMSDRKEWVQTYIDGLKLLGLKYEERTEPWNGACGVFHPMLTESVVQIGRAHV